MQVVVAVNQDEHSGTGPSGKYGFAEQVMGIATGFAASQILFISDALRLFDLLKDGPRTLESISADCGIKPRTMERLLIGCCSLGLMKRVSDTFELTEVSRNCLVRGEPGYAGGLFSFFKRSLYPLWQHLETGLREESPQWEKLPEIGQKGDFKTEYRDDQALHEFQDAMFQLSHSTGLAACDSVDFSCFETAVDIGGGTGGFLIALCQRNRSLRGSILDLPKVENAALERIASHGFNDRISFSCGDFFEDPFPAADLYILGDILHDWGMDKGTKLLQKAYAALPPHGAVCIAENLFNENRDGPVLSAVIDLTMLLATHGEQHSPAEFAEWLGGLGFQRFEHQFLPAPRGVFIGWKR